VECAIHKDGLFVPRPPQDDDKFDTEALNEYSAFRYCEVGAIMAKHKRDLHND